MSKIFHIAVLIAFLGGIIAPACGFSWGGKFSVIEICTTEGIESRVVENNAEPTEPGPHQQASKDCQFCFANVNLNALVPDVSKLEKVSYRGLQAKFKTYEIILQSRQGNDHAARAPPALI